MRFAFKCWAVEHTSGRVTLTPLEVPELAVHATSLAAATEELVLALDDKIGRAHPRQLPRFGRGAEGELLPLDVTALPGDGSRKALRSLRLGAVLSPAQKPYVELRLPRADLRVWLPAGSAAQLRQAAGAYLTTELQGRTVRQLLQMRSEGRESLVEVAVDVRPLRLSELGRQELRLDERPPVRPTSAPDKEDDDGDWDDEAARKRRRRPGQKPRRPATPTLDRIATPWHRLAVQGRLDIAFERESLVAELTSRLREERPEALVLVGREGVGKTAVLHAVARRLNEGLAADVDDQALHPLFFVDGARLIAGEGFLGDWQQQVLAVLKEAFEAKVTLCLGHLIDLLDAGKSAHSDQHVAQLLAPALAAGEVRAVAEATSEAWAKIEERNASFARLFTVIRVEDPPPDGLMRILGEVARRIEEGTSVALTAEAVEETRALCARLLPYGALVGNAVSFLRRFAARAAVRPARLGRTEVVAAFAAETGVPEALLRDDLPLDGAVTRGFLRERVKGQDTAVDRVAEVVSVIKANLAERRRPVAVLLFAGPTGVGKTELAKALCELVFGARDRLVRLDMGEYAGGDALVRLLGEPGMAGHLTASLRRQPFSLVLLDEIEKAHPAVFDALLGVFGEGRLTDGAGRTTDFRNAVFVLTSNLGADTLRARPGFGVGSGEDAVAHYRAEVRHFFRPELFNRLDDVVVFEPLGPSEIAAIVTQELRAIGGREGLLRRDVVLEVDGGARALLAARGTDARLGARPLKRALERTLVAPLASYLVEHRAAGPTRMEVTAAAEALDLRAVPLGRADMVPRSAIQQVLDRAATTRAEARRWQRSPAVGRLQREIALFDRDSRHVAFWADRALAEERGRMVATGRELVDAFAHVHQRALTVEDVAYEAFFSRAAGGTDGLAEELDQIDRAIEDLGERLFCAFHTRPGAVVVTLLPARGAWDHGLWLAAGYQRWAGQRGAQPVTRVANVVEVPKKDEERRGRPRAWRPSNAGKVDRIWRWKQQSVDEAPGSAPVGLSLQIANLPAAALLLAEHGVHRFTQSGVTTLVRVHVRVGGGVPPREERPEEWGPRLPQQEIRHVWPEKELVKDLRANTSHPQVGGYEPDELLRAFARRQVFEDRT